MSRTLLIVVSLIAGVLLSALSDWIYDLLRQAGIFTDKPSLKRFSITALFFLPLIILVALPEIITPGSTQPITPTLNPVMVTETPLPPTETPLPLTATPTPIIPSPTSRPTNTRVKPTATPIPKSPTPRPTIAPYLKIETNPPCGSVIHPIQDVPITISGYLAGELSYDDIIRDGSGMDNRDPWTSPITYVAEKFNGYFSFSDYRTWGRYEAEIFIVIDSGMGPTPLRQVCQLSLRQ